VRLACNAIKPGAIMISKQYSEKQCEQVVTKLIELNKVNWYLSASNEERKQFIEGFFNEQSIKLQTFKTAYRTRDSFADTFNLVVQDTIDSAIEQMPSTG